MPPGSGIVRGHAFTIREVAERMAQVPGRRGIEPVITGRYRVGEVRNCFADIAQARSLLGYEPQVTLEAGLVEMAEWLSRQWTQDQIAAAHA